LYCFTIIDSAAKEKFLAEWKSFVSQLISKLVDTVAACLASQCVLLLLHSVGCLAKLWIFIVELKQFLYPVVVWCMVSFKSFELIVISGQMF